MNQRQKIIAVAVAVPVIALIAYAATSSNDRGNRGQPKQAQNKVAAKTVAANKKTAKKKVTLGEMKDRAQKILDKANAVTTEEYEKMRALRPSLPTTLDEYKADVKERSDKVLNMTEEEFAATQAARAATSKRNAAPGGAKGGPKGGPAGAKGGAPKGGPGGSKGGPKGDAKGNADIDATPASEAAIDDADDMDDLDLPSEEDVNAE